MKTQNISITIPDGYEVAPGVQPRKPKKGEYYLNSGCTATPVLEDYEECQFIILRKTAPKYITTEFVPTFASDPVKVVEIKALEDAVGLFEEVLFASGLAVGDEACEIHKALLGVLK